MTDEEAQLLLKARGLGGVVPPKRLPGRVPMRTARARRQIVFPLVLLSPGVLHAAHHADLAR